MNNRAMLLLTAFAMIAALTAGCTSSGNLLQPTSLLDDNWGRSYETAKYNQILNPEAGRNLEPSVGLDGIATENAVNKYDKSFSEKKDKEVVNILKLQ